MSSNLSRFDALAELGIKELKKRLKELGVDYKFCSDKDDFVQLLIEAEARWHPEPAPAQVAATSTFPAPLEVALAEPELSTVPSGPVMLGPGGSATNARSAAAAAPRETRARAAQAHRKGPAPDLPLGPAAMEPLIQEVDPLIQELDAQTTQAREVDYSSGDCDAGNVSAAAIRQLKKGSGWGPNRLLFREQFFWQELFPEHVTLGGLEFHVGLADGNNLARKCGPPDSNPRAVADDDVHFIKAASCVRDGKEDEPEVEKAVRAASSWGDRVRLRRLLASCYVTVPACGGALCEAARRGHEGVVKELLRARASPVSDDGSGKGWKTALHIACEQGQEDIAKLLVASRADLQALDSGGRTPCELAREQDLGMMAKRLELLL